MRATRSTPVVRRVRVLLSANSSIDEPDETSHQNPRLPLWEFDERRKRGSRVRLQLSAARETVITEMGRKVSHDLAPGLAAMHLVAPGVCRGFPGAIFERQKSSDCSRGMTVRSLVPTGELC